MLNVIGGKSFCKCKNNKGIYPDCEANVICTQSIITHCEKNNGQCVVENFQAICLCKDNFSIYPYCNEVGNKFKVCMK